MRATISAYEQPPAGVWPATFVDIEERESRYERDGKPSTAWRWLFDVDVNGNVLRFSALSDGILTLGNKPGRWLEGLRNRPGSKDEDVNFEQLKGTRCQLVIKETKEGFARLESIAPANPKPNGSGGSEQTADPRSMSLDDDKPDPF